MEDVSYQEGHLNQEELLPETSFSTHGSPLVNKRKKQGRKSHKAKKAKPLLHTESSESAEDEVERSHAERKRDMAVGLGLTGVTSFQERTSSLAEKLLSPKVNQDKDLLDYKGPSARWSKID
jgi:NADPH-dependent glutamate synthase beta subunit-like oxidoreductase